MNIEASAMRTELIDRFILQDVQQSYDPYDIWNTSLGQSVKGLYYRHTRLGVIPAGLLTVYDNYINNKFRVGYNKRDYAIVYALRAIVALEMYASSHAAKYLAAAENSLEWLSNNYSKGYNGYCWGMNMPWVSKNAVYSESTPFITHTPYALEAFEKYYSVTGSGRFNHIIEGVFRFVETDLVKFIDSTAQLALSYSPVEEKRIVINANSYAMFCYSIFLHHVPGKRDYLADKITRIYNFIRNNQKSDGSWMYYADDLPGNFIDCFHTCFVLKNLLKANKMVTLEGLKEVVEPAYAHLKANFWDAEKQLFRRFSISDKISIVQFDLYDNAEMLNLAYMLKDEDLINLLQAAIQKNFVVGKDIYSQIILPGKKINKNMLRWAVMPYLNALAKI